MNSPPALFPKSAALLLIFAIGYSLFHSPTVIVVTETHGLSAVEIEAAEAIVSQRWEVD